MKKIIIIKLIIVFAILSGISQEVKIEKINEYDDVELLPQVYKDKIGTKSKLVSFKSNSNTRKNLKNSVIASFNVKKDAPVGGYFVALYEGPGSSKYIGFYDSKKKFLNYYEINLVPSVNYSANGEYLVVYSKYKSYFFVFDKKGNLLYESSSREISNNILYNIFIDNTGENILINTSYELSLLNIIDKTIKWKQDIKYRRIRNCIFNENNGKLYSKALMKVQDWKGKDKYAVMIINKTTGTHIDKIVGVEKLLTNKNNILVKSSEKWQEYEVK